MDSALFPEGVKRCSPKVFLLWSLPWLALLAWGGLSAFLCLWKGLNQTNMSNVFAFALWIVFDLAVIALGAGAFFTGFLTYVIGRKELKSIINAAVIIGFICYSGAVAMLGIDIGQPIRGWFIFWHANVHSMLTEVSFCITCYLMVLAIEYIPIVFENRQLDKIREFHLFGHNLHHVMGVFAATGTFLSFFHQGSLGGMFGVMYARPFAARWDFYVWPTTFFLFVFSAIAAGPCFTILCTKLTEALSRKKLFRTMPSSFWPSCRRGCSRVTSCSRSSTPWSGPGRSCPIPGWDSWIFTRKDRTVCGWWWRRSASSESSLPSSS